MQIGEGLHLSYCTNIHPAHGWDAVFAQLQQIVPSLKERLVPDDSFGIGLRLSSRESEELLAGEALAQFEQWLAENDLYVFTINGFPYGDFHSEPVKAQVHAPDWRSDERVAYTQRLIEILAALLPDDHTEGSISTSPLSYKAWIDQSDDSLWQQMTDNVLETVVTMIDTEETTGKHIHLDLEPEPDGLIENSRELVAWFEEWLLGYGARELAERLTISAEEARTYLRRHVQACFDTCHVAVAYENPADVLQRYEDVGLRVGKIQISSALQVTLPDNAAERENLRAVLGQFVESTYLHQVIQRNADGSLTQYADLPDALPHIIDEQAREWRIHFHVPIFLDEYGTLASTQQGIVDTVCLLKDDPFTRHLEVETYTWDVLPTPMKANMTDSIERELRWSRDVLA